MQVTYFQNWEVLLASDATKVMVGFLVGFAI